METIKHIINGYEVIFINFGRGDKRLFVNNIEGIQIYGHKTTDAINYLETAKRVIAEDMKLATVGVVETVAPIVETTTVDKMICLSDRKEEFKAAMKRGFENDLHVEADFEPDTFLVVNRTNQTDYRVKLETSTDGKVWGSCECRDFSFRRRICKHQSEVLQDVFFGVTESSGVILK